MAIITLTEPVVVSSTRAVASKTSTFLIEEQTGSQRSISLAGRALPYRPLKFSGKMRAEFTWYPGNPEATVQVLGASEDDTTVNGIWKNKFLGDTIESSDPTMNGQATIPTAVAQAIGFDDILPASSPLDGAQVTSALALVKIVDSIRRSGQLVKVTWDEFGRYGILTQFSYTLDNRQDIAWEMTFGWISQDDPIPLAKTAQKLDLADTQTSVFKNVSNLAEKLNSLSVVEKATSFSQGLVNLRDKISNTTDQFASSITSVVDGFTAPMAAVKTLSSVLTTLKNQSVATADYIGKSNVIAQFQFSTPDANSIPFGEYLQAKTWQRDAYNASRVLASGAGEQQANCTQQLNPDVIASVTATQNLDLRDLSTRFYGTPNSWHIIAAFNGLTSSQLQAGQVVFVPRSDWKPGEKG